METMSFKTNAKCMGCLTKIEETLQSKINSEEWNLDLSDPERILTVTSDKLTADDNHSPFTFRSLDVPSFSTQRISRFPINLPYKSYSDGINPFRD